MKAQEKLEFEEKRRIRRYHERKNREQFCEMLSEFLKQGMFNIKTKWNRFVSQIKNEPRYLNLMGQPGSSPKELFDEFIQLEKENFKRQKGTLKQIIKVCPRALIRVLDRGNQPQQQDDFPGFRWGIREVPGVQQDRREEPALPPRVRCGQG